MEEIYAFKIVDDQIVRVRCPKGMKFPEYDADDQNIYENTHWEQYDDAANHLKRDARAAMRMATRELTDLQKKVDEARVRAAKEIARATLIFDRHGWHVSE